MKTKTIGKNIFADPNVDLESIDKFLDGYGLKIIWLFENGVVFDYPKNIEPCYNYSGDCTFLDSKTKQPVLIYLENFGELEFIEPNTEETLLSIPLISDNTTILENF